MTDQLALFDGADAPIAVPPRRWTICRYSEPVIPNWYEVQTKWNPSLPDEWKDKEGYNYFMSPTYWNGVQWCLADDDQRPSPTGTTYPGCPDDRWREVPADFDPTPHTMAMRMQSRYNI